MWCLVPHVSLYVLQMCVVCGVCAVLWLCGIGVLCGVCAMLGVCSVCVCVVSSVVGVPVCAAVVCYMWCVCGAVTVWCVYALQLQRHQQLPEWGSCHSARLRRTCCTVPPELSPPLCPGVRRRGPGCRRSWSRSNGRLRGRTPCTRRSLAGSGTWSEPWRVGCWSWFSKGGTQGWGAGEGMVSGMPSGPLCIPTHFLRSATSAVIPMSHMRKLRVREADLATKDTPRTNLHRFLCL